MCRIHAQTNSIFMAYTRHGAVRPVHDLNTTWESQASSLHES